MTTGDNYKDRTICLSNEKNKFSNIIIEIEF